MGDWELRSSWRLEVFKRVNHWHEASGVFGTVFLPSDPVSVKGRLGNYIAHADDGRPVSRQSSGV